MHPHLPLTSARSQRGAPRGQSGVVLVVALVMLAIIGLMSAAIMRNAISTDVVSDNNRRQTQANQAAQAALRYCEKLVTGAVTPPAGSPAFSVAAAVPSEANETWFGFANWLVAQTAGGPALVPSTVYTTSKPPQCMAQHRTLTGANDVIVVTARGFSDNHEQDAQGHTKAGSVIWLQSIVQLETP
jgi:type IV pilus assembly protein PilX